VKRHLIVINDFGEENIPGLFISEPIRKGHVRKFRKGFNTTHGTKITACSRLKTMVENDQLKLRSKALITELKNFVATGTSFRAKVGQTDDLISATLLALRMMNVLKDWDPRIYNTFTQAEGDDPNTTAYAYLCYRRFRINISMKNLDSALQMNYSTKLGADIPLLLLAMVMQL
jgi:hypothetical protein